MPEIETEEEFQAMKRRLQAEMAEMFTLEERQAMAAEFKANIPDIVRDTQDFMSNLLQQETKIHEGRMWLFTLGKPVRPLSPLEINE